jgi:predicted TPR repeat methyltransferase
MKQTKDILLKSRLGSKDVFGFEGQSQLYSQYRPTYPQQLIERAANATENKNVLLDVGCGTGQLSQPFSKLFAKVFGIDVSETQLEKAREKSEEFKNISYSFQNSHEIEEFWKTEINQEPIDLVTFGQVLHWLDHNLIFSHYKQFMSKDGAF